MKPPASTSSTVSCFPSSTTLPPTQLVTQAAHQVRHHGTAWLHPAASPECAVPEERRREKKQGRRRKKCVRCMHSRPSTPTYWPHLPLPLVLLHGMATHDHDAARSRERSGSHVSLNQIDHGKKQNQARSTVQSQRKLFIHYERERGRRRERGWEGESSHASGKKETEEESVTLVFPHPLSPLILLLSSPYKLW